MNDPNETQKNADEQAHGEREGWSADELGEQASQQDEDQIERQIKRGDEEKGESDDRDYAGTVDFKDTPQGREEAKNDTSGKANDNG